MNSKPTLPIDVVQRIVGHCEYPVVQALRKTNSTLRDLVAEVSPKSSLTSIHRKSCMESIQLKLTTGSLKYSELCYPTGNILKIEYIAHANGCRFVSAKENRNKSKRILEGEDYKKIFWQDWQILLDYHENALLESFVVDFEKVADSGDEETNRGHLKDHCTSFLGKLENTLGRDFKVKNCSMTTSAIFFISRRSKYSCTLSGELVFIILSSPSSTLRIQISDTILLQFNLLLCAVFLNFMENQWTTNGTSVRALEEVDDAARIQDWAGMNDAWVNNHWNRALAFGHNGIGRGNNNADIDNNNLND